MTRKRGTFEERVEQLRREPAFRDLVDSLRRQTGDQLDRFSEYCDHSDLEGMENGEEDESESETGP